MRVGIVLQARTGSSRLPGKVIRPLDGVPMVVRIMRRLDRCRSVSCRVLATSDRLGDLVLVHLARQCGWHDVRGHEEDVLARYREAAERHGLDHVVRATADNPLVDPAELDRLVAFHLEGGHDYSSNRTEEGSGLPVGAGVEVFSRAALEASHAEATDAAHREHVDEFVQAHPERFFRGVLEAPPEKYAPHLSLTVDRPDDLDRIDALYRTFGPGPVDVARIVGAHRPAPVG